MSENAVEMVRKTKNQHYEETKGFSVAEQIKFVKKKADELQRKQTTSSNSDTRLVGSGR